MAQVTLEHVSKVYQGGVNAVAQFSLGIHDRELVVLVGPSGCGKTTTLRMIAGLEDPTGGSISIGDRVVNHVAPKDRNIAMVFQNYGLYPHLNVYRNMAFALELRSGGFWYRWWKKFVSPAEGAKLAQRKAAIRPAVVQTARQLGIEHLLLRLPGELSGGERQRVALGRAIVREPAVFLFDEPLSNLDAKLRVEMRRELKQLHKRLAATMVYVTHDQVEAMTLGDRIVVMNRGEIQQVGAPFEVYRWPRNRFVAGFLGSPAMNFLPGQLMLEEKIRCVRCGSVTLPVALNAGSKLASLAASDKRGPTPLEVEWGIRPENLAISLAKEGELQGTVDLVEHLGDSALAHVIIHGTENRPAHSGNAAGPARHVLAVKMPPSIAVQAGAEVGVKVDSAQTHVFAIESSENLSAPNF